MSSGYTPVFGAVFEGSLCGRYPDTAAWLFFLALADWKGEIDKTPEYIATVTGMPLSELLSCIDRFMQPDPRSRSQVEEGRKLVLIDPSRNWGWRVVNIGFYRRKASGLDQISDGRNAEKVRRYRDRHRATPRDTEGHRATPSDTNSYSYTNKETEKKGADAPVVGLDVKAWERWTAYRTEIRKPLKQASIPAAQKALAAFGSDQLAVVDQSIAQGWQGLFELKPAKNKPNGRASEWT